MLKWFYGNKTKHFQELKAPKDQRDQLRKDLSLYPKDFYKKPVEWYTPLILATVRQEANTENLWNLQLAEEKVTVEWSAV